MRHLVLVLWTICWPVFAFLAIGLAMMGDPVSADAYAQQQRLGLGLLLGAAAIFLLGYWLILRKRTQ